jgi:hypothetical protein
MLVFCSFWSQHDFQLYLNWVIAAWESWVILDSDDVVQMTTFLESTVCSQIASTGHPVPLFYFNHWHFQHYKTWFLFFNFRRTSDGHSTLALSLVSYSCLHWTFLLDIFKYCILSIQNIFTFADTSVVTASSVLYFITCHGIPAIAETALECIRKYIKLQPQTKTQNKRIRTKHIG